MNNKKGKIIILSAPSGAGKSTIISRIINDKSLNLGFSISATSRPPRGQEQNGREYYFLSGEEFSRLVAEDKFVEWEEVYPGTCYGTLRSEVDRITSEGKNLIMDIDVKGGINIKKIFGCEAVSIFIMPPSAEILEQRLRDRATDTEDKIKARLAKSQYEISFAPQFDVTIVNDDLDTAVESTKRAILNFIQ